MQISMIINCGDHNYSVQLRPSRYLRCYTSILYLHIIPPSFSQTVETQFEQPLSPSVSVSLSQIAETYAFLPREAVTRFLMSCGECQKRMHINPSTAEFKGNGTHVTRGGLANSGDIIN